MYWNKSILQWLLAQPFNVFFFAPFFCVRFSKSFVNDFPNCLSGPLMCVLYETNIVAVGNLLWKFALLDDKDRTFSLTHHLGARTSNFITYP